MNRAILVAAVGIAAAAPQYAADVRNLTLTEAVHLACRSESRVEDRAAESCRK